MITYEDFLKLDIPENFGTNDDYGESDEMDAVFDQCPASCNYAFGASQYVILSDELDEVIKIPFKGTYYYSCDYDNYIFEEFTYCKDYCERSVNIYEMAVEAGVEPLFAETKLLGYTRNHYPIYTQERIEYTYGSDEIDRTPTHDSLEKSGEINHHMFPDDWLAIAIDNYGEELVKRFVKFCKENCNDLHWENIGYKKDGSAVVIDYAGFHY